MISNELKLAKLIDRFGVDAVMGRSWLSANEILRMQIAETIMRLYAEMQRYDDWTQFKRDNPDGGAFLFSAMKLAHDMGLIDGS